MNNKEKYWLVKSSGMLAQIARIAGQIGPPPGDKLGKKEEDTNVTPLKPGEQLDLIRPGGATGGGNTIQVPTQHQVKITK